MKNIYKKYWEFRCGSPGWMPQRKFFVATEILLFDFELLIGGRRQKQKADNSLKQPFGYSGRLVSLRSALSAFFTLLNNTRYGFLAMRSHSCNADSFSNDDLTNWIEYETQLIAWEDPCGVVSAIHPKY